jgi:hypothetical protein
LTCWFDFFDLFRHFSQSNPGCWLPLHRGNLIPWLLSPVSVMQPAIAFDLPA